jgi:alanine racemase
MKKLEVSRKDLKDNIVRIIKMANGHGKDDEGKRVKVIAVVKANGMGLGLVEYSKLLLNTGITMLAVANVEEACTLRKAGIQEKILMLTPTRNKQELKKLIENHIILTIGNSEELNIAKEIAKKLDTQIEVQLKIDTGFGRYGFLYTEINEILDIFKLNKLVYISGMYTHFSKPIDEKWTKKQFDRFLDVVAVVKKAGYNPGLLHVCESTAFLKYRNMYLNAVRIGSAFQGRVLVKNTGLKKIGTFKTNIVEIKNVPKGYNISYSNEYKVKKDSKIAIVPVGYMDGLNRKNSRDSFSFKDNVLACLIELKKIFKDNRLKAIINGKEYNIIGRLGMYHAVIDITGTDIKENDEVILDIAPLQTNDNIKREYI